MWVGFAIKHVGKKLAVTGAVAAGAILATKSGRKMARVLAAGIKGAGEAAVNEIRAQRQSNPERK